MSDITPADNNELSTDEQGKLQTKTESSGCFTKALALGGVIASVLFLLNFTLGIFEIPDNLPIIGNLDEVAATTFMLTCLSYLGINIIPRKSQK